MEDNLGPLLAFVLAYGYGPAYQGGQTSFEDEDTQKAITPSSPEPGSQDNQ